MKKIIRGLVCLFAAVPAAGIGRAAETTWIYSVQVSASVQAAPPQIVLSWPQDPLPILGYTVFRKAPGDSDWGSGTPLPGGTTSYTDRNVATGVTYEYQIVKQGLLSALGAGYTGYGYISTGIAVPLAEDRGKVVLVVDRTCADALASELERLREDLAGDGWSVVRLDVDRDASPASVRHLIQTAYSADPSRMSAVFLFGHVPVVRSGNLNVDGHLARPMPADVFYGDMDGNWTDANGDGVYDQSYLPSDVELEVGRVDFADMPGTYALSPYPSELELLRRYLDKDHNYREAIVRPVPRALVGNQFGDFNGEAFAASGYRNFAPLLGAAGIVTADADATSSPDDRWITRLTATDYQWAYGCGAGSDFSMGGLGTHGPYNDVWGYDLVDLDAKATFYLMFGSWLVDWAQSDNIMRSALATPDYGLACAWSGRPHLFFHPMGMGETIGYGIRLSQNNNGLYQNQVNRQLRGVHIALMGDPTLRLHQVAPPGDVGVAVANGTATLTWHASPDAVLGYHVYRAASFDGPFTRLTDSPVSGTSFTDSSAADGSALYMVRAVTLQAGPSGSYFNASQGAFSAGDTTPDSPPPAPPTQVDSGTPPPSSSGDVAWIDDAVPAGAAQLSGLNDTWQWVTGSPAPFSGTVAHQSTLAAGLHEHLFNYAYDPLVVNPGDVLYAYVYLDPQNPPAELMLSWGTTDWEHRAYWGSNQIAYGADGSPGRHYMGPLPAAGQWIRLEIPASAVALEGQAVVGMGFSLYDGRVTWDAAGKRPGP